MKAEIVNPKLGDLVQSPTNLLVTIKIINQGPDSMYSNDTLVWDVYHAFGKDELVKRRKEVRRVVAPLDSFYFNDTIYIDGYEDIDNYLVEIRPKAYGKQDKRPLDEEYWEDYRKDNIARVYVVHRKAETGNVEILNDEDFSVYPNPILGSNFTLSSEPRGEIELRVLDCLGSQVFAIQTNKMEEKLNVQLPQMQAGIYFISIKQGGELWNKKVIIQD